MEAIEYNKRRGYSRGYVQQVQRVVGTATDGLWGPATVAALATWQFDAGLRPDGKHGPVTREAMASEMPGEVSRLDSSYSAPPLPRIEDKWGYDHCPDVYRKPDPHWSEVLGTGTVAAGMVRLVSGWRVHSSGLVTYARGPDSWISLDTYSVGFGHWWAKRAPGLLARMAREAPEMASHCWGTLNADNLRDPNWLLREIAPPVQGKMSHAPKLDWLLRGWYEGARHPDFLRIQVDEWLEEYGRPAVDYMRQLGWTKKATAVMLGRMWNTGSGTARRCVQRALDLVDGDELAVIEAAACRADCYDEPDRWERVEQMGFGDEDMEPADWLLDPDHQLALDAAPRRVDGTLPGWASNG